MSFTPNLAYFNYSKEAILEINSSDFVIKGILL